jgi:hypothetical protein
VILDRDKQVLEMHLSNIERFLPYLKIKLHPDKTKILPLRNGITFLGYRVFYNFKLLTKRNIRYFYRRLDGVIEEYNLGLISKDRLECRLNGWFGYAKFADTFNLRRVIVEKINSKIINREKIFLVNEDVRQMPYDLYK